MGESKTSVFVSHVHEDEALAAALKRFLEGIFLDADVFVSGRDLAGGEVWMEQLRSQLEKATVILALVTHNSETSKWVHFEAGAGFTDKRTIPVAADGVTIATLSAPLKLLHARAADRDGLIAIVQDIAKRTGMRKPDHYPGIDEALLALKYTAPKRTTAPATSPPRPDIFSEPELDVELAERQTALRERAAELLAANIERQRGAFELPSSKEIVAYGHNDLQELARAVGQALVSASIP